MVKSRGVEANSGCAAAIKLRGRRAEETKSRDVCRRDNETRCVSEAARLHI